MNRILLSAIITMLVSMSLAQSITTNGVALTETGGAPTSCLTNGFKTINSATDLGSCIQLTTSSASFENGAFWVCDPIDLNQTFKITFTANFGSDPTTGDGIAFLLQTEGLPQVIGGRGGGIGYSDGDGIGCLSAPCPISPSLAVEFDTYDHTAFSINDLVCDHMSMQTNGVMSLSNTINGPSCLLPGGVTVKDGNDHDICITWDPSLLEYEVYFDNASIGLYLGDIRTLFLNPAAVWWGFTSAKGPAPQTQNVCNVQMETNIASPSCACTIEDATFTLTDFCDGNTNSATGIVTLGGSFAFNPAPGDGAIVNPSTGEVINGVPGTTYTIEYTTAGSCPGVSSESVTVLAVDDPSFVLTDFCEGAANSATSIATIGGMFSFAPDLGDGSTINTTTGEITAGVSGTTYTVEYLTSGICSATLRLTVTVLASDDPSFTLSDYCDGATNSATVTGLSGGSFSFDPDPADGSSVDPVTGEVSNGVSGTTYTLEYLTSGTCPDSTTQTVSVTALDDPAFTLSDYCDGATNSATVTGLSGGSFSFDPDPADGSSVDPATGEVSNGVSGTTYTLEYLTSGTCPDSTTQTVSVTALDDPSFTLSDYCDGAANSANVTGLAGGTFSFDPDPADGSSVDPATGEITSGVSGTTYTLEYLTSGTCPDSTTQTVSVTALDDPAFTLTDYCVGSSNNATGIATIGGTFSFDPDPGDGSTVDGSTGEITSGVGGTTYTIEYVTSGTCPDSTTQTVTTLAIDDPSFSYTGTTFCLTGGVQVPVTIATSGGTFSGSAGLFIDPTTGEIDVATTGTGSFDVTYTTSGTCPDNLTITIDITASPDATFSYVASPYCQSGTATITFGAGASGGVFSEATGDLVINAATGEVDLSASLPGTYTVFNDIAAAGGCAAASASTSIEVLATDDPSFTLTDYCVGSSNSATGIATIGGTFNFDPDPADGASIDPATGAITMGVAGSTYFVQYTTTGVCNDDTTISVTVNDTVYAGQNSTLALCQSGPNDSLFNYLGTAEVGGAWSGPTTLTEGFLGSFDPSTNIAGVYTYVVISSGACPNDTAFVTVDVIDPVADFTISAASGSAPLVVDFTNTSTGATSYFWDLDVSTSIDISPQETYTNSGNYTIMLIATNGGCADTVFTEITVFGTSELVMPNVFSPNNDGVNDQFQPIIQGMEEIELLIFNRWGELIMKLTQLNQGWDGRSVTGEYVPEGTYYYTVSAKGLDGEEYNRSGYVALKR